MNCAECQDDSCSIDTHICEDTSRARTAVLCSQKGARAGIMRLLGHGGRVGVMGSDQSILYASSADGYLAYEVLGGGPIDLLRIDDVTMASIDSTGDEPHRDRFDRRLASFARV